MRKLMLAGLIFLAGGLALADYYADGIPPYATKVRLYNCALGDENCWRAQDANNTAAWLDNLRLHLRRVDLEGDAVQGFASRLTALEAALAVIMPTSQAATPAATPAPGTYSTAQDVVLTCSSPSPTIRYTLDGTVPTTSSTAYTAAIHVTALTQINAICYSGVMAPSLAASYTYAVQATGVALANVANATGYDASTGDTVSATVTTPSANATLSACGMHVANVTQTDHTPAISSTGGLTWTPRGSAVFSNGVQVRSYTAEVPTAGAYTITWDANTTGEVAKGLAVQAFVGVTGFGEPSVVTSWAPTDALAVSLTPTSGGSLGVVCGAINGSRSLTPATGTTAALSQTQGFGATVFAGRATSGYLTVGVPNVLGTSGPAVGQVKNAALAYELIGNASGGGGDPGTPSAFPDLTNIVNGAMPALAEPDLLSTVRFIDLGTNVTRVSDSPTHYATDGAWNADESLFMLGNGAVLHGTSFASVYGARNVPDGGYRWGNTVANKNKVFGTNRAARQWAVTDVTTNVRSVIKTYVASDFGISGTLSTVEMAISGDGGFDNNDQWAVVTANYAGDSASTTKSAVINMASGEVKCVLAGGGLTGSNNLDIESARMSQDGNWVLVNFRSRASNGVKGLDQYRTSDCTYVRSLSNESSHLDACVASDGEQVAVQAHGGVTMYRLTSGLSTTVANSIRHHVSCTNRQRPGWAYLSSAGACDAAAIGDEGFRRIYALKLDGSLQGQIFAWDHRPCPTVYAEEPSACASPSGTRVAWKTAWNGGSIHSFVAGK